MLLNAIHILCLDGVLYSDGSASLLPLRFLLDILDGLQMSFNNGNIATMFYLLTRLISEISGHLIQIKCIKSTPRSLVGEAAADRTP